MSIITHGRRQGKEFTQKALVRTHLELYGAITPLEALNLYGCFRLADVVLKLRRDLATEGNGWTIKTVGTPQKDPDGTRRGSDFATYELHKPAPTPAQLSIFPEA